MSQSDDHLPISLGGALSGLVRHPYRRFVRFWNWKTALLSAVLRTSIFFTVNLTASWDSAVHAAVTEIVYRAPMTGTLASVSQSLRRVQPAWRGSLLVLVMLPALAHGIEFGVHALRGTEKLYQSVLASVGFTMCSSVVSYWLHRRDVLVVGAGGGTLASDLCRLPGVLLDILLRNPLGRWAGDSATEVRDGRR